MKKGDIVTFTDDSWQLTIFGKFLEHRYNECIGENFTVVALGCVLPTDRRHSSPDYPNDTIVRGQTTGNIVFTQERFLRLAIRMVTMAEVYELFGETVKIIEE